MKALHTLLSCKVMELPVDLMPICKKLGVRISSYSKSAGFIQKQELQDMVQKTEGLTFFVGETPVILYDDTPSPQRIRFTIAHIMFSFRPVLTQHCIFCLSEIFDTAFNRCMILHTHNARSCRHPSPSDEYQ